MDRFPIDHRKRFLPIMREVDYVEFEALSGPYLGYFCGTCSAYDATSDDNTAGMCLSFKFPVRSYGCCNSWDAVDDVYVFMSNGKPVRLLEPL